MEQPLQRMDGAQLPRHTSCCPQHSSKQCKVLYRLHVPLDASNISVTKVSSLGVTVVGQELLFSICRPKWFFWVFLERGKDAKRLRAELTLI